MAENVVCNRSLNVALTWVGPVVRTASAAGSVAMRTACAEATGAPTSAITDSVASAAAAADFTTGAGSPA